MSRRARQRLAACTTAANAEYARRGSWPNGGDARDCAMAHVARAAGLVEPQAHRERHDAWYDRSDLPLCAPDPADYLHVRGATGREFTMKCQDAIIDELHRVREDFGKAHDFDVRRIAATIRQHEAENPEGIIRELTKRTTRHKKASD
jgi:hypothetical protein